jgi:hypothetical protein
MPSVFQLPSRQTADFATAPEFRYTQIDDSRNSRKNPAISHTWMPHHSPNASFVADGIPSWATEGQQRITTHQHRLRDCPTHRYNGSGSRIGHCTGAPTRKPGVRCDATCSRSSRQRWARLNFPGNRITKVSQRRTECSAVPFVKRDISPGDLGLDPYVTGQQHDLCGRSTGSLFRM